MRNILIVCACVSLAAAAFGGCKKGIAVECNTKMRDVAVQNKDLGASFTVSCPADCQGGSIWGTDTYTTDSSVCMAGIHAGVITKEKGGAVKVTVVKSLETYTGSERNGITTSNWGTSWGDTAFQVSK
ncbi:MAG: hypothetical protein JW838_09735 [Spirochaetes bacterium]|nr:hypothetical protein [Spirochaetota bacterium]